MARYFLLSDGTKVNTKDETGFRNLINWASENKVGLSEVYHYRTPDGKDFTVPAWNKDAALKHPALAGAYDVEAQAETDKFTQNIKQKGVKLPDRFAGKPSLGLNTTAEAVSTKPAGQYQTETPAPEPAAPTSWQDSRIKEAERKLKGFVSTAEQLSLSVPPKSETDLYNEWETKYNRAVEMAEFYGNTVLPKRLQNQYKTPMEITITDEFKNLARKNPILGSTIMQLAAGFEMALAAPGYVLGKTIGVDLSEPFNNMAAASEGLSAGAIQRGKGYGDLGSAFSSFGMTIPLTVGAVMTVLSGGAAAPAVVTAGNALRTAGSVMMGSSITADKMREYYQSDGYLSGMEKIAAITNGTAQMLMENMALGSQTSALTKAFRVGGAAGLRKATTEFVKKTIWPTIDQRLGAAAVMMGTEIIEENSQDVEEIITEYTMLGKPIPSKDELIERFKRNTIGAIYGSVLQGGLITGITIKQSRVSKAQLANLSETYKSATLAQNALNLAQNGNWEEASKMVQKAASTADVEGHHPAIDKAIANVMDGINLYKTQTAMNIKLQTDQLSQDVELLQKEQETLQGKADPEAQQRSVEIADEIEGKQAQIVELQRSVAADEEMGKVFELLAEAADKEQVKQQYIKVKLAQGQTREQAEAAWNEEAARRSPQPAQTQEATSDQENQERVSGEVREGQEPVQAEPEQGASGEAAETGGVVQTPQQGEVTIAKYPIGTIISARNDRYLGGATRAEIVSIENKADGSSVYKVKYTNNKGQEKTAWLSDNEIKGVQNGSQDQGRIPSGEQQDRGASEQSKNDAGKGAGTGQTNQVLGKEEAKRQGGKYYKVLRSKGWEYHYSEKQDKNWIYTEDGGRIRNNNANEISREQWSKERSKQQNRSQGAKKAQSTKDRNRTIIDKSDLRNMPSLELIQGAVFEEGEWANLHEVFVRDGIAQRRLIYWPSDKPPKGKPAYKVNWDNVIVDSESAGNRYTTSDETSDPIKQVEAADRELTAYLNGVRGDYLERQGQEEAQAEWEAKQKAWSSLYPEEMSEQANGLIEFSDEQIAMFEANETISEQDYADMDDISDRELQELRAATEAYNNLEEQEAEPKAPRQGKVVSEDGFIRPPTKKEKIGGRARQDGFNRIPDKDGYEKVYKPYGKSGAGYYYSKIDETTVEKVTKEAEPKAAQAKKYDEQAVEKATTDIPDSVAEEALLKLFKNQVDSVTHEGRTMRVKFKDGRELELNRRTGVIEVWQNGKLVQRAIGETRAERVKGSIRVIVDLVDGFNGGNRTLFHEAFHVAWKLFLTQEQIDFITRVYGKMGAQGKLKDENGIVITPERWAKRSPAEQSKDIEEAAADAAEEWLLKRSTATTEGKIWARFWDRVRNALVALGIAPKNAKLQDIFYKLEQGKLTGTGTEGTESRNKILGTTAARALDRENGNTFYADGKRLAIQMSKSIDPATKKRYTADAIWRATGWEQGKDGFWKFELPDYEADWQGVIDSGKRVFTLGEILDDPELYTAYPELRNLRITLSDTEDINTGGYDGVGIVLGTNTLPGGSNSVDALRVMQSQPDKRVELEDRLGNVLAHELQHAIQRVEGFARGAGMTAKQLNSFQRRDYKAYYRVAGEVEADNVARRRKMTAEERRAKRPELTERISRKKQIVTGVKQTEASRYKTLPTSAEIAEAERQYREVEAQFKGTDKWLKAPNGKPTNLNERQWVQVRTQAFKAWFGDWENDPKNASKVVDENGEPKIVWHGTRRYGFTEFDKSLGRYYFTDNGLVAEEYANSETDVYDVFLNIKNPHYTDFEGKRWVSARMEKAKDDAEGSGNDGVIFTNIEDSLYYIPNNTATVGTVYVAFSPTQIKSATANVGTFSAENPDIRYKTLPPQRRLTEEQIRRLELVDMVFALLYPETFGEKSEAKPTATAAPVKQKQPLINQPPMKPVKMEDGASLDDLVAIAEGMGVNKSQAKEKLGRVVRSAAREAENNWIAMLTAGNPENAQRIVDMIVKTNTPDGSADLTLHLDDAEMWAKQMGLTEEQFAELGKDGYTAYLLGLNVFAYSNKLTRIRQELTRQRMENAKQNIIDETLNEAILQLDGQILDAGMRVKNIKTNAGRTLRHARELKTRELDGLVEMSKAIHEEQTYLNRNLAQMNLEMEMLESGLNELEKQYDELMALIDPAKRYKTEGPDVLAMRRADLEARMEEQRRRMAALREKMRATVDSIKANAEDSAKIESSIAEKKGKPANIIDMPLRKMTFSDGMMAVMYSNMLSGVSTHYRNMFNNALNMFAEGALNVVMDGNLKSLILGVASLQEAGAEFTDVYKSDIKKDAARAKRSERGEGSEVLKWRMSKRLELFRKSAEHLRKYDTSSSKKVTIFSKIFGFIPTTLAAEDAFFYMLNAGMQLSSLAMWEARQAGGTKAQIEAKYQSLLDSPTENMIKQVIYEASRATYNYTPEGLLGVAVYGIEGAVNLLIKMGDVDTILAQNPNLSKKEKALLRATAATYRGALIAFKSRVMPFTRVVANVLNGMIDYTLFGMARALGYATGIIDTMQSKMWRDEFGKFTKSPYAKRNATRQVMRSMGGTVAMMLIAALFKDSISGGGPDDWEERKQLMASGWRPYSFKIGNRWYSYIDTPLGLAFALVGEYYDNKLYNAGRGDRTGEEKLAAAVQSVGATMLDKSFLSSAQDFFENFGARGGKYFQRSVGEAVGQFTTPNLFRQVHDAFRQDAYKPETIVQYALHSTRPWSMVGGMLDKNVPKSVTPYGTFAKRTLWWEYIIGAKSAQSKEIPDELRKTATLINNMGLDIPNRPTLDISISGPDDKIKLRGFHKQNFMKLRNEMLAQMLVSNYGVMDGFVQSGDRDGLQAWLSARGTEATKKAKIMYLTLNRDKLEKLPRYTQEEN